MRKCDCCGEPLKGKGHEVYNENLALQRGILYCDECKFGNVEDDEEKVEPQSIVISKSRRTGFSAVSPLQDEE